MRAFWFANTHTKFIVPQAGGNERKSSGCLLGTADTGRTQRFKLLRRDRLIRKKHVDASLKIAAMGFQDRAGVSVGLFNQAANGEIDLAPFVTHTRPLQAINEAFELMHEGLSIRTVIQY